ncbi:hypothetical protein VSR82_10020 [Burkholderia sp. JPY481]|uniref:hypothetical protein n=1 Tax=unclassified Paraburkholderia TaxID=2615204 RepID=UPI003176AFF6
MNARGARPHRRLRLQQEMWAAVRSAAAAQPTPITALVMTAINDVLNAPGSLHPHRTRH